MANLVLEIMHWIILWFPKCIIPFIFYDSGLRKKVSLHTSLKCVFCVTNTLEIFYNENIEYFGRDTKNGLSVNWKGRYHFLQRVFQV